MSPTTRSSWIHGVYGKALSIGDSVNLRQLISQAVSSRETSMDLSSVSDDSPLSSPLSSPPSSRPSSPAPTEVISTNLPFTDETAPSAARQRRPRRRRRPQVSDPVPKESAESTKVPKRKNQRSHDNRKAKRRKASNYNISSSLRAAVVESAAPALQPGLSTVEMEQGSNAYLGQRRTTPPKKAWRLDEVVGEGSRWKFDLVEWDGSCSIPMASTEGTVFGLLLENPRDPTWPEVHRAAAEALETRRGRLKVAKSDKRHRRGNFTAQAVGYGYGGGQEEPKSMFHEPNNRAIFDELLALTCFIRLASYASSAFAMWAPRLYRYYSDNVSAILSRFNIRPNFASSIFASATFNFGPKTVTFPHIDYLNYVHGWCSITALGNYDYKRGGHLILWDLGLVVEFPPGSTILIPSAYLKHSNTAIHKGESRYSFTQYTAGGLFRYMEDGGRTRESMTREERAGCEEREEAKMADGWHMYTTLDELSHPV